MQMFLHFVTLRYPDDGQSVKSKRKKSVMPTNKLLVSVYNRIVELMELMPPLLTLQTLPDTLVLQVVQCFGKLPNLQSQQILEI